ncbi:hypothetical protein VPNG_08687 [Cytospora leucostoma]|uniref:AAA+ ATPase lid domain-containing protein n=1 Tax=Cytospora leucostoma TaxID=1230097 RepID=A0A423W2E1_9PEZI|nr:hypothetical protein VPNG_08687 [Cytospora leucostoma]
MDFEGSLTMSGARESLIQTLNQDSSNPPIPSQASRFEGTMSPGSSPSPPGEGQGSSDQATASSNFTNEIVALKSKLFELENQAKRSAATSRDFEGIPQQLPDSGPETTRPDLLDGMEEYKRMEECLYRHRKEWEGNGVHKHLNMNPKITKRRLKAGPLDFGPWMHRWEEESLPKYKRPDPFDPFHQCIDVPGDEKDKDDFDHVIDYGAARDRLRKNFEWDIDHPNQREDGDDDGDIDCRAACCTGDYVYNDTDIDDKQMRDYINSLLPKADGPNEQPSIAIIPRALMELRSGPEKTYDAIYDDERVIMSYRVFGFVLRSREWGKWSLFILLAVYILTPPKRNNESTQDSKEQEHETAFDRLVLEHGQKPLIQSLVAQHFRDKQSQTEQVDIVKGKVFLRVLEYYAGILFLTTNRVGDFDEAFASRIHVSLYYPELDKAKTLQVFKINTKMIKERFETKRRTIDIDDIEQSASKYFDNHPNARWNGRQIRNACQTALALAEFEAQGSSHETVLRPDARVHLKASHFEMVQNAYLQFAEYMNSIYNSTSSTRAKEGKLRATWSPEGHPGMTGVRVENRWGGFLAASRDPSYAQVVHTQQQPQQPQQAYRQQPLQPQQGYQHPAYPTGSQGIPGPGGPPYYPYTSHGPPQPTYHPAPDQTQIHVSQFPANQTWNRPGVNVGGSVPGQVSLQPAAATTFSQPQQPGQQPQSSAPGFGQSIQGMYASGSPQGGGQQPPSSLPPVGGGGYSPGPSQWQGS